MTAEKTKMNAILGLLKQMNASEELAKSIAESLESYVAEQKAILEESYKNKLAQARALMLEEFNKTKTALAKKVSIFFEARADKIESQMAKQVAIRESAAEASLRDIKALLEGLQVNANGDVDLQALQKELSSLRKQVGVLREQRETAVVKANRADKIARKVLERNRTLEEGTRKGPIPPAATGVIPPISEGATPPVATAAGTVATQIPVRKTGATPTTTRVVSESVTRRPTGEKPAVQPTGSMTAYDPRGIAAAMDE